MAKTEEEIRAEEAQVTTGGPLHGEPANPESDAGTASPEPASDPGEQSPGITEVTVGGQRFQVTEEMKAALEKEQTGQADAIKGLQTSVDQLQTRVAETPVQPVHEPTVVGRYDYETRLFEQPAEAIETLKKEIKEDMRAEYQTARNAEQSGQRFWEDFYKANDDLDDFRLVVNGVLGRDADLGQMGEQNGARELAERTRAELIKMGIGKEAKPGTAPVVEGAANKAPKTETRPEATPDEQSLGDVLRQRRRDRADGRRNMRVVK